MCTDDTYQRKFLENTVCILEVLKAMKNVVKHDFTTTAEGILPETNIPVKRDMA